MCGCRMPANRWKVDGGRDEATTGSTASSASSPPPRVSLPGQNLLAGCGELGSNDVTGLARPPPWRTTNYRYQLITLAAPIDVRPVENMAFQAPGRLVPAGGIRLARDD